MPSPDLSAGLIFDLIWKTAAVVALLYGVLWAVRRMSATTRFAPGGAGITVLHSLHLGPGRSVHLLAVGGKNILVGATSQQISLLTEVGPLEEQPGDQDRDGQLFDRYLTQASSTLRALPSRFRHSQSGKENGD